MRSNGTSDSFAALAGATSDAQRERILQTHPGLAQPKTIQALYDRVAHYLRKDLSKAGMAAQSSLWLARRVNHPESLALSLRALGNVLLLQDHPSSALEHFDEALRLFLHANSHGQAAQTQLNIFAAYLSLGDYSAAHERALAARQQLTALGDTLGLARLENNLGSLLFRQENFLQARRHWRSALQAFKNLGQSHDAAIALRNLAVCEISLNNFREALDIYAEVSRYCKRHKLTLLLHEVDYNIAYLYFLRGDHDRALNGYRLARERSLKFGDAYHAALCDLDEAELYLELNLLPDATAFARRAASAFHDLGKSYEAAKAFAFQAIAAARLRDDHQALELLHIAHEAFSSQGHVAWASLTFLYEALILLREGRRFEAKRSAMRALQGFQDLETPSKTALCQLLLARLHLDSDDLSSARASLDSALHLISDLDVPHILFQAQLLRGDIEDRARNPEAARDAYYVALKLLHSLRTQLSASDLHIPFPQSRLAVYDRLLSLEALLSPPEIFARIAFDLVEGEKARTVSDLLASRTSFIAPSLPARSGLVEQVQGLREELRWYYKKMAQQEMSAQARESALRRPSFNEMEEKLLASLTEIAQHDREFGHLQQALTVNLEQAQALLASDEVILEYFVGEDLVTVVVVSQTDCSSQPIAISSEISELRRLLDFQVSRVENFHPADRRRRSSVELARHCLKRLYEELVAPVFEQLRGFTRIKIIPHGFLTYLPFHAFVVEDRSGADLGDRFLFSYAPGIASLLFSRERKRSSESRSSLVFRDRYDSLGLSALLLDPPWQGQNVPFGTTRSQWQELLRRPWSVVQLPLDADFRLDNPVLSGISVSGTQMTLLDLFQIELAAEVVVVTGCEPPSTSLGTGDELLCLSRALLYAGPSALVMPLRRSRSQTVDEVLRLFYDRLASGRPADEALQAAQRVAKSQFPHVADWAGLAIYGL